MGLVTAIIAVPIAVFTAIYLVEYGRGRFAALVSFMVDILTGIPSIVAALFIYAGLGGVFRQQRVGFAVSLALVLLMIPVVVRSTEEMLKIVPNELREASYALGVPKWKTIVPDRAPDGRQRHHHRHPARARPGHGRDGSLDHPRALHGVHQLQPLQREHRGRADAHLHELRQQRQPAAGPDVGVGPDADPAGPRPQLAGRFVARFSAVAVDRPSSRLQSPQKDHTMAQRIDVKDVSIYYGSFKAVEDVSMTIEAGRSPPSSARPAAASRPSCAR
jgi:hypothetical protein